MLLPCYALSLYVVRISGVEVHIVERYFVIPCKICAGYGVRADVNTSDGILLEKIGAIHFPSA